MPGPSQRGGESETDAPTTCFTLNSNNSEESDEFNSGLMSTPERAFQPRTLHTQSLGGVF